MKKDEQPRSPRKEDYERALRSMDTFMDIGVDDLMTLAQRAELYAGQRVTASVGIARIMSRQVHSVHPDTLMSQAAHLMLKERISGLPVVDDDARLVGIITEADFLRALGVPAHQPTYNLWQTLESLFHHLSQHAALEGPNDPVSEHMVRDVICASPEQNLHDVLQTMKNHRVKRLLVCDQEKHVLGIVTRSDLVRIFFESYAQIKAPAPD